MNKSVGKSVARVDAYEKATGRAKYMDDLCDRSAYVAKVCHAAIAHGFSGTILYAERVVDPFAEVVKKRSIIKFPPRMIIFCFRFVFRRERDKRQRSKLVSFVALSLYVKGCNKAMHFTLDGQAVFVYAPDAKDDCI